MLKKIFQSVWKFLTSYKDLYGKPLKRDWVAKKKIVNCLFTHEALKSSYELV